jgi:hypothetical protein
MSSRFARLVLPLALALSPLIPPRAQGAEVSEGTAPPFSPKAVYSAVTACLKPDWPSQFLPPISAKLASRTHLALALGSVLAEEYLAAQAEDPQHTRNLNKDLLSIAKPLGIHTEMLERSKSLSESAEKKAWSVVCQELDATETDLVRILRQNKDEDLIVLVRVGAWLRAAEAVSQLVSGNYTPNSAALLQHRELAPSYTSALEALSAKTLEDPTVAAIHPRLLQLKHLFDGYSAAPPSEQEIKSFAQTARSVLHDILSKP